MKKIILLISVLLMLACPMLGIKAHAEEKINPIYAGNIADGTYDIEVTSNSSMFRIIDGRLTVSGEEMTAVMTLSGQGYEKLYMGTGDEALSASDSEYSYYSENSDGKYTYEVTVEALDMELDCAAWSIRKEKWYDRIIVFKSDALPSGAVENRIDPILTIAVIGVIIVAAGFAAVILIRKHGRK